MRKASSVILKVIAGFFFYMVCLLAFVSEPRAGAKLGILIGFSVPAVAALSGGLALTRFRNWRRETGIVLLCASGFTAFLVFSFACLLMTEEFRRMMRPDTMTFFSDYLTGGGGIVGLTILGLILIKANKKRAEQCAALNGDSAALHPTSEFKR
jgi:hypothetical protein